MVFGIHARFHELQGDLALDWLRLLGEEHGAHTAFANFLAQLIATGNHAADEGRRFRRFHASSTV